MVSFGVLFFSKTEVTKVVTPLGVGGETPHCLSFADVPWGSVVKPLLSLLALAPRSKEVLSFFPCPFKASPYCHGSAILLPSRFALFSFETDCYENGYVVASRRSMALG